MSIRSDRPIDRIRNGAILGRIGNENEGAIQEVILLDDTMYFVKQRAMYAMRLADAIDQSGPILRFPTPSSVSCASGLITPWLRERC